MNARGAVWLALLSLLPGCTKHSNKGGIVWTACGAYECATVDVPADDVDPANGTIGLRVFRAPAIDRSRRIGTLVWVVGGPGISGVDVAPPVYTDFKARLFDVANRFDVVFYERRGSGGALNCIDNAWVDDYRATAPNPTTAADWAAVDGIWQRFADGCSAAMAPARLPLLSSDTEARDIDRIRAALGEETISIYAVSGGANAGASYVTLFPDRVHAGVVDSPLWSGSSYFTTFTDPAEQQEAALTAFFADCGSNGACAFHGGQGASAVAAAYDALATSLLTPIVAGGRPVGAFDLAYAVQALLAGTGGDLTTLRDPLATMLATAEACDGTALLATSDPWWYHSGSGYDTGMWTMFLTIPRGDQTCPPAFDLAAAEAAWPAVLAAAPRTGAAYYNPALSCLHWPTPRSAPLEIGPAGSPVLVVAGTHDLNVGGVTGATKLVNALGSKATLVQRNGYGHQQWLQSTCAADTENAFLVDPATWTPPPGSICAN